MQHQPDENGQMMPKSQASRMMDAGRILKLEREINRLEQENRDLHSRCDKYVGDRAVSAVWSLGTSQCQ